jgi:hypothetical protein
LSLKKNKINGGEKMEKQQATGGSMIGFALVFFILFLLFPVFTVWLLWIALLFMLIMGIVALFTN